MAYRIVNGVVECDTAEEALAVMRPRSTNKPRKTSAAGSARQSAAIKKSWVEARKLAKKEGISVAVARSKLAKANS